PADCSKGAVGRVEVSVRSDQSRQPAAARVVEVGKQPAVDRALPLRVDAELEPVDAGHLFCAGSEEAERNAQLLARPEFERAAPDQVAWVERCVSQETAEPRARIGDALGRVAQR